MISIEFRRSNMVALVSEQVWSELENNMFAVVGMVTAKNESRTAGIVYAVRNRKLYFGTLKESWKARHIAANGHVSVTVPIAKRIPFVPWIKIPAATITFPGQARVLSPEQVDPEVDRALHSGMEGAEDVIANSIVVEITPEKNFVTYGVGVSLKTMRNPAESMGKIAVGT
jgi:hypothetical protein